MTTAESHMEQVMKTHNGLERTPNVRHRLWLALVVLTLLCAFLALPEAVLARDFIIDIIWQPIENKVELTVNKTNNIRIH